jgi:hypothetical protein
MNALADPFKQLVDRRLWPIALLLVAALVAVPFLLSKDPEVSQPLPVATTEQAAPPETASVVTLSDADKRDRLRAVLGARKDPFRPAQIHHVRQATDGLTDPGVSTAVDTGNAGSGGEATGGVGPSFGGETPGVETIPTPVPPTYELYSLKVRFGPTDGELVTRNVKRLTGLPGGTHPAVLYLGLTNDLKSAVFMVDNGVEALGDGRCDPTPEDCQTLTLRKGETEFFTRGDKQYELDLVGIYSKQTRDGAKAAAARTAIATNGRKVLRKMIGRTNGWEYDARTGTVKKRSRSLRGFRGRHHG